MNTNIYFVLMSTDLITQNPLLVDKIEWFIYFFWGSFSTVLLLLRIQKSLISLF